MQFETSIFILLFLGIEGSRMLRVKYKYKDFFSNKIGWYQIIQKCIIQREMAKKKSAADGGFRR